MMRAVAAGSRAEQLDKNCTNLTARAIEAEAQQKSAVAVSEVWQSRAEQAERALAEAVKVMEGIANHPDKYDDGKRSYAIGWAFWNIQGMARAFVAQHGSDSREGK